MYSLLRRYHIDNWPREGGIGRPFQLTCGCEGAYCRKCLQKWIDENAKCAICKRPLLLSTKLEWVRIKNDCGIPDSGSDDDQHGSSSEEEPPYIGGVDDERSLSLLGEVECVKA